MKSIISRYGEMTSDPSKLIDSEGEEMSLNKVDKALQSVGITIQDTNHQFRAFDDVITELAEKWSTIDTNTQRYIATVMAGNRQQSRFLALVSNGERLAELSEKAANAEDTATLQVLKTMDSIEAKTQQLQTSLQSLYTSSGVQNLFKDFLDIGNQIVKTFTQMPTVFNLPIPAILKIGTTFASLSNVVTTIFSLMKLKIQTQIKALTAQEQSEATKRVSIKQQEATERILIAEEEEMAMASLYQQDKVNYETFEREKTRIKAEQEKARKDLERNGGLMRADAAKSLGLNMAGIALSTISGAISDKTRGGQIAKGLTGIAGSAASMAGMGMMFGPHGAAIGAALGGVMGIIENINFLFESSENKANRLKEAAENAKNNYLQQNAEAKDLQEQIDKLKELEKIQNESAEARVEFLELSNSIASSNPELVGAYDAEGNAIINLTASYRELAEARGEASEALDESIKTSMAAAQNAIDVAEKNRYKQINKTFEENSSKNYNNGKEDKYGYSFANNNLAADFYSSELIFKDLEGIDQEVQYQISELLTNLANGNWTTVDLQLKDKNVQKGLNLLNEKVGVLGETVYQLVSDYTAGIVDIDRRITEKKNSYNTLEQSNLLNKINDTNTEKQGTENEVLLNSFSEAGVLIDNYILSYFEKWKDDLPKTEEGDIIYDSSYGSALEQFLAEEYNTLYNNIYTSLEKFWSNGLITEAKQNEIINVLNNRKNYTQDQLKETIVSILGIEIDKLDKNLVDAIDGYYKDSFDVEDFNKKIVETASKQKNRSGDFLRIRTPSGNLTNQLGESELTKIFEIYTTLDQGITNKTFSVDQGQKILNSYLKIWDATTSLDDSSREVAQGLISSIDDLSLDNIKELKTSINNLDLPEEQKQLILNSLDELLNLVPVNLNTEINTFVESISSGMGDFESALNKAIKGMNYKDAVEIATKMGVSVTSFRQAGTKFFTDDLEKLKEAYIKVDNELLTNIEGRINNISTALATAFEGEELTEESFNNEDLKEKITKALEDEGANVTADQLNLEEYWKEWSALDKETRGSFEQYVVNSWLKVLDEAKEADNFVNTQIAENYLANGDFSNFLDYLQKAGTISEEQAGDYQQYFDEGNFDQLLLIFPQYADTIVKTFKDIGTNLLNRITSESAYDNYVEINSSNAAAIQELVNSGLATYITDENGKNIGAKLVELTEANIDKYNEAINKLPLTPSEKAKEAANATKALYENSSDKMIEEIIKNNSLVSAEIFETMRQRFTGIYGEELGNEKIKELFKNNRDGTYSIDLTQIQNLIEQGSFEVTNEVKELLANNINNIISSITGLVRSQSKGYTNLADMQKFVNNLNKISNSKYGFQDIFEYSDILHAYQLSTQGIIAQIQTMKNQLSNMTKEQQEVAKQLIADTARQFAEQIDISSYISAIGTVDQENQWNALQKSITDYNNVLLGLANVGEEVVTLNSEAIKTALEEGGLNAIEATRQVAEAAGKTLTTEEVETAYRGQVTELTNVLEQLVSGPGAIVDNAVAEILRESGYGIQEIEGTGQSLITSVGKLNVAYRDYLNRLEKTNEATLAELNEATANVLENNKREENDVINALSKAVSMSYSEFSEIFTNAGIRLTEQMVNQLEDENIIKRLGGGKMQIIDFKSFADLMDWDTNADSEEYISAFRAYNDALIELNRKTEKVITDEIKSISEAKAGDQINLTQLSVELGDTLLAEIVDKYGAYLSEGILTLGNDANIPALIREIAQEAANKGLLLEDTMADLADTLNDVLQKYTDLINNGIVGQLTNVEAQQLQTQANSLGFKGKLDFKETANGLKLSEQSAASLYNHLKSVDTIQSHLVLNKLYDSITSSEGKLKTMSKTMVTIDNIQKKITENEERITKLRDSGKNNRADQIQEENNKLKDQLQLYKDIRMEQMDDPDSYSFMDKELPNSFKGPQNYWNSVGKAFTAINQAGESGYMEIADFYNFINEATNLVQMSGQSIDLWGMQIDGSAETAANLIEKGFGALSNIDGEGVKIDLTRLGVDFSKGADGMASGFTAGIKSLAKSQIALIDAEIAMLETFVAMEALGDIDVDKNGVFDFVAQELGTLDEQGEYIERFGIGYKNAISKIKKYFETSTNKDIQNAYKNFKINGHSIEELLNASEEELKNWGIKGKTLQTLLHKFYELSQSDEFSTDPGEIWKQIAEALSGEDLADLDITFYSPEIGQVTIENGNKFGIDFESATAVAAKEFLKEHGKNGEDLNKELEEAFEKYQAGTSNEVELTAVLMAKGIVETKDDGMYVNNEGPFKNEEDPKYKEAIARAALKDIGITGDIEYDAGTGTATGKYRIGTREIVTTSKDGKTTYYSDMDGANPSGYGTPEELMQAEYKLTMESIPENQQYSENEFRHERYGYKLEIEATLETKIDEEGLKVQAIEALSKPASVIKACIEDPENESYKTISSNGETITYDLNGIIVTVDNVGSLEQQIAAAQEKISGIVDPDGLILKISTSIQNAFQNLNIAQLFIDGLTTSLQVHSENGTIQFTSNPTITALGANLGQGIAASIASASSNSIKNFFGNDNNISTITTPIQEGVEGAASSATVTDTQYEIPHATATLKKMDINQVEAASLSSSTLGGLLKTVSSIFGGSSSDLTLESATAAIKKLSVQSVGETDLQTQIQTEIVAKVGSVDVSSIITAQQEIVNAIGNISNTFVILKNRIADLNTNSINANASISNLKTSLIDVANSQGPAQVAAFKNYLNAIDSSGPNRAFSFKEAVNAIASYGPSYAADFVRSVNNIKPKTVQLRGHLSLDAYVKSNGAVSVTAHAGPINASFAKGNVGVKSSSPKGKNKTLMGELGPELVVSNGRYYVVGENGAEMVDLPDDAIVFNHLQTKKLLANGKGGRGTPVTNEKNAVSYATGNVSGPALVSPKQAIASLKQLRAMWQAMLTASAKQLGSQAGKTINKPKANNNDDDDDDKEDDNGIKIKTAVYELQRWYNLLRQIDKTEKDITYQEKLQTQYQSLRVADGKSLYKSYKTELSMLGDQINRSKELAKIQKSWYDDKRAELAASAYGKIFTYTEDGLQQYVEGKDRGVDFLAKLFETDNYGNPTGWGKTSATQLQYIQEVTGINLNDLLANDDGTLVAGYASSINHIVDENGEVLTGQKLIDAQTEMVNNFIDFADDWRDELDGLYDSYREQLTNVIDNQNKQNEIMQKVVDNQIEVENKVYNALIDAKQAIIDNAQKEMETYQKNTDDMIDSLNKTLDKERQLYDNQKNSDDLLKLQRQLAILQRSGGSTSQIVNLQQQIATKQQDMYFEEKEEQIKALQEASDLQLKKMQEQIDLMAETLEYQKQNGLLWEEIAAIMRRDPQDILEFITDNSADWNSQSALQISQSIAEWQTKIEVYTNSRDEDFISYYNDISSNIKDIANTTTNISNGIRAAGTTSNGYVYGVRNVYKKGGLIDFTGPAWVDGTPSQPEAVLNANETKFVQNKLPNILNSADTLQERVKDLQNLQTDWLSNISNIINNNDQNNSVNIEHVELNMNVEQMSNSADAKKLGREAFDELLNIARKTGKNSVSRR